MVIGETRHPEPLFDEIMRAHPGMTLDDLHRTDATAEPGTAAEGRTTID